VQLSCQHQKQNTDYITRWKNGEESGITGKSTSKIIKMYLLEKYNNSCAICNWSMINPFTKTLPLELEHIDGDYTNNKEENLIILCPNCHSLTKTYSGAEGRRCSVRNRFPFWYR
jgi:5-methylcytosine-specific restriction endonuclease McrA